MKYKPNRSAIYEFELNYFDKEMILAIVMVCGLFSEQFRSIAFECGVILTPSQLLIIN